MEPRFLERMNHEQLNIMASQGRSSCIMHVLKPPKRRERFSDSKRERKEKNGW